MFKRFYSAAEINPGDPEPKIDPIPQIDPNVVAAQQAAQIAQQAAWLAQQSNQKQPQQKKSYDDANWLKDPSLFKKGINEMIEERTIPLQRRNEELQSALSQMYATTASDPNAERTRTKANELQQKYRLDPSTAMIMAKEQFGQSVPVAKPTPPKSASSPDSKAATKSGSSETERFSDYDVPIVEGKARDMKSIIRELRASGKMA